VETSIRRPRRLGIEATSPAVDTGTMARTPIAPARLGTLACSLLAAAALAASPAIAPGPAEAGVSTGGWDTTQQRQVLAASLLDATDGSFDGAGPLTAAQANNAMAALATRFQATAGEQEGSAEQVQPAAGEPLPAAPAAPPVAHTARSPVTVVTFDRMLVEELGLSSAAAQVQARAGAADLHPPGYFGTEVAARLLELRFEHPVGSQRLDLFPGQAITRAEAAWSLATVMKLSTWSLSSAREALSTFELPAIDGPQRQALQIAVSRVGYPYIWGGTTDNTADGLEHGGFDCSGFAWRVFKVSGLSWGNRIQGRTAAEQAGEIPRSQRLRISQLQPGDLLFFGSAHFNSHPTERNVIHEGIYLGDNWVIHSSGQGVYVLPLRGSWLGSSFAWGRRVIG
jgi:cell wall-associated NlpC family hydrolase